MKELWKNKDDFNFMINTSINALDNIIIIDDNINK